MGAALVLPEDRLDDGEERPVVDRVELVDRDRHRGPLVERREPRVVGGDRAVLDREKRVDVLRAHRLEDLEQALGALRRGNLVLHLVEAHVSRAREDLVRAADAVRVGADEHEKLLHRPVERRRAVRDPGGELEHGVDRAARARPSASAPRRSRSRSSRSRRRLRRTPRTRSAGSSRCDRRACRARRGGSRSSRARGACTAARFCNVICVAIPSAPSDVAAAWKTSASRSALALDDLAVAGHEPHAPHRRRERAERGAGAMRARAARAADAIAGRRRLG